MNVIIPICGLGKRFLDAGYDQPKPLINIFNKKMLVHILDKLQLNTDDKLFIIFHTSLEEYNFSNIIKKIYPRYHLIPISHRTDGAAETVLFGIEYILNNNLSDLKNTLIIDCDTIYNINIIKKLRNIDTNAVIYFEDFGCNPIYSYIQLDNNNKIRNIIEKEKISNNANTGAYYFSNIDELANNCKYIINNNIRFKNEYYMSCVIKQMLKTSSFTGIKISRDHYISLGTPQDLQHFENTHLNFLFDLDGTLVKTDDIYFRVWYEILEKYNKHLTLDIYNKYIYGNSDKYVIEQLLSDVSISDINIPKLKDDIFVKYINEIIVIDGVKPFIKNLKKIGHSVCIVTNCNRDTCELILKHIDIIKYVDHIIIGNECAKPKPYPDPYLHAITLLGTTESKCIIFEDSKPGLLSALTVLPKNIVGVNNGLNETILKELNIKTIISNYNIDLNDIIKENNDLVTNIKQMIFDSLHKQYNIQNINIDINKLKGGYISDVIKVIIDLESGEKLDCVLKYENDYISSLTQMAYKLGLFDREYYFYENISSYVNINIPKYIGTIKDANFVSKGILLENINKDNFYLGLDLNKQNINTALNVIDHCAKLHSLFWNKDLLLSFGNLKKHNNSMFNPVWGDFIKERWPIFVDKWKYLINYDTLIKLETVANNFSQIQEALSDTNLTLCHGDVKSGNIFYKKISPGVFEPYFIDWQYIAHGKGVQDIVFFIIESFSIENIKEYVQLFKQYYYIKLKENGVISYSNDEYNNDFKNAVYHFPFFVAIWFGTTPTDELIDISFPLQFIQKFIYFIENVI
jgi:HAD superfamily hydrolase (TIGR01509 family)